MNDNTLQALDDARRKERENKTYYCVKSPEGRLITDHIRDTEFKCQMAYAYSKTSWLDAEEEGYKVVKVKIEEVGE